MPELKTVEFYRPGSFEADGTFSRAGYYLCKQPHDRSGEYVPLAVHQKWIDDLAKERDVLNEKNAALSDQLAVAFERGDRLREALEGLLPHCPSVYDDEVADVAKACLVLNDRKALGEFGEEER